MRYFVVLWCTVCWCLERSRESPSNTNGLAMSDWLWYITGEVTLEWYYLKTWSPSRSTIFWMYHCLIESYVVTEAELLNWNDLWTCFSCAWPWFIKLEGGMYWSCNAYHNDFQAFGLMLVLSPRFRRWALRNSSLHLPNAVWAKLGVLITDLL